jgi:hypothetical protein
MFLAIAGKGTALRPAQHYNPNQLGKDAGKGQAKMLNLYFKRAKIFLHTTDDGQALRYNAIISANGPVPVPDWVKYTLTYQCGVKDQSVIDLTPPTIKPRSKEAIEAEAQAYVVGSAGGATKDAAVMAAADPEEEALVLAGEVEEEDEPVAVKAKKTAVKHGIK